MHGAEEVVVNHRSWIKDGTSESVRIIEKIQLLNLSDEHARATIGKWYACSGTKSN